MWYELKIAIGNYGKGTRIPLKSDPDGVPSDPFWRNRYADGDIKGVEPVKRESMKNKLNSMEKKTPKRGKK